MTLMPRAPQLEVLRGNLQCRINSAPREETAVRLGLEAERC
jgi:hypothetical protein